ncbi:hypothetical protein [Fulvivirga lutea]|uniref:Uncharacterized protein n=1 Tax=Fulvivirga lutea TaxID=2810512 RepID=A0A974WIS9_9BACT|nr:hypothetical protein [Fulvivirga lutea]QSE96123.1 hypothetical protein JR347_10895 [Fulvivirga lutea]
MTKSINIILRLSIGIMAIFLTYKMGTILFNASTENFKKINVSGIEITSINQGHVYLLDIYANNKHYVKSFTSINTLADILNEILINPLPADWTSSLPLSLSQSSVTNQIEIEAPKNTIEKLRVNGKLIMGSQEDSANFSKILGLFFLAGSLFLFITWLLWVISLIKHLNKHHTIQNYPLNNTVADAINGWKYILSGFKKPGKNL